MKNKLTARLSILMCLVLVISMFAACSVKDKNNDETTTTLTYDDQWYIGNGTYEPVTIGKVELVDLVNQALGEEAGDFNGDLNTLTPEQIKKVEDLAADKGLIVGKDDSGNTVIKEYEVSTTKISDNEFSQIMSQASVSDPSNISPSEYEEISKIADESGMAVVTKPSSGTVDIVKPVVPATTAASNKTTVASSSNVVITPTGTSVVSPSQSSSSSAANTSSKTETKTTKYTGTYAPSQTFTAGSTNATTKAMELAKSQWVNTYGGNSNDLFNACAVTSDGGIVTVGNSIASVSGDSTTSKDSTTSMIAKYNEKGKLQWNKTFTGDDSVYFEDVAVMSDGSIIVVGYVMATDFFSDAEYRSKETVEGLIMKFSAKGEEVWRKAVGGSASDLVYTVEPTSDGGFIIGGKSESSDGDLKNVGTLLRKAFIFKYDAAGNIAWRQALSGSKHCSTDDIAVDSSGNVYATISNASGDGEFADLEGVKTGRRTAIVVKLNNTGKILWKKCYYDTGATNLPSIALASDGGCVVAGNYTSGASGNQYSFKDYYNGGSTGTQDGMIIKIDSQGVTKWMLPLIGFENDYITGISKIDGGFAVSGYTASSNRDFSVANKGNYDSFIYTLTDYGKIKNYYSFGGSQSDNARAICASGNSIYVAGSTNSSDVYFANCENKATQNASMAYVCRFEVGAK